jgi:hypothetical protein
MVRNTLCLIGGLHPKGKHPAAATLARQKVLVAFERSQPKLAQRAKVGATRANWTKTPVRSECGRA